MSWFDRHTPGQVGKGSAEQKGRQEGTDGDHPVEAVAPGGVGILGAIFKGDAANDQADQQQEQGQIEAAEHGGVPVREGGKGRAAGRQQPDFVAIPDGADGVDDGAAFLIVLAKEGQEHAHAEVEAFQEEEADPQDGDQDKPKDLEKFVGHVMPPWLILRADRGRSSIRAASATSTDSCMAASGPAMAYFLIR